MNFLEVNQIINKMIYRTKTIQRGLTAVALKKGLTIDKNSK